MALAEEDIAFSKTHLGEWLPEQSLGKPPAAYEIELREPLVRVEEELKHQRELMREGFAQIDKRFEQMDKRFEQIDKRFDKINDRFDTMLKRQDRQFYCVLGYIATGVGLVIGPLRYL